MDRRKCCGSRTSTGPSRRTATGATRQALRGGGAGLPTSDLAPLEPATSGNIKAVVDRRDPPDQIAEAHRYVEQEHEKGNVVIAVAHLA
jgi:hypothetical protein